MPLPSLTELLSSCPFCSTRLPDATGEACPVCGTTIPPLPRFSFPSSARSPAHKVRAYGRNYLVPWSHGIHETRPKKCAAGPTRTV